MPDVADWPGDYVRVWYWRDQHLKRMRTDPTLARGAIEYYRTRPVEFILHWCDTYDPRNAGRNRPAYMPFVLFPRQVELVQFVRECMAAEEHGLIEKARDMGATWVACAFSVWLWRFYPGAAVGWGSRKEQLVDKLGDPDSIFEKMRILIRRLPREFWPKGFNEKDHMAYMRIVNPETGATITGEAGDNIGRGGRKLIYWKDEAQPLAAKVLTPHGWSTMGDMAVGVVVCGPDGESRRVIGINDAGVHQTYRVRFSDGTSTECSENHLWTVKKAWGKREVVTLRTSEIAKGFIYRSPGGQVQYKYRLPITEPVHFAPRGDLPLHPYIVGALIGDGSTNSGSVSFTSADSEIVENIALRLPDGCKVTRQGGYGYRIVDVRGRMGNKPENQSRARLAVRASGIAGKVAHEKAIPDGYKFASVDDRIELLSGLMDTDGSASGGTLTYHTCSRQLADDVRFVVQSLGGIASLNTKPDHRGHRDMFCLHIVLPRSIPAFKLTRKNALRADGRRWFGRIIVGVDPLGCVPVRCISVDAPDGLYLTDHCIVTHNSAHYERPEKIEAALADNTRVQIDISSVNGLGNVFHRRREAGREWEGGPAHEGVTNVFVMDWRDHPLKDDAWYAARKKKADADGLSHVFAQEVDRNYSASVDGTIIPAEWVAAAIDADKALGFIAEGANIAGLDVADEGGDKNALALRKGACLLAVDDWGEGDTGETTRRAVGMCAGIGPVEVQYDSVGVGAGVKSEANRLASTGELPKGITFTPWSAGAGVEHPDKHIDPSDRQTPLNRDFYSNLKAQAWWNLRRRFERTYRARTEGLTFNPEDMISIPSTLKKLRQLQKELAQATASRTTGAMKLVVDKSPPGTRSPNLADAVVMAYYPITQRATGWLLTRNAR